MAAGSDDLPLRPAASPAVSPVRFLLLDVWNQAGGHGPEPAPPLLERMTRLDDALAAIARGRIEAVVLVCTGPILEMLDAVLSLRRIDLGPGQDQRPLRLLGLVDGNAEPGHPAYIEAVLDRALPLAISTPDLLAVLMPESRLPPATEPHQGPPLRPGRHVRLLQ